MKLILMGATGMVGSGVLAEALRDPEVEQVACVGRRATTVAHEKLLEVIVPDLFEPGTVPEQLKRFDACIWAIGISSFRKSEADYARVTEELTLLWARALLAKNPELSFCYCCGRGADGPAMWARVRRRLESELKALPFKHFGSVRPGFIQPGPGIQSQTKLYQFFLNIARPLLPTVARAFPEVSTTSEKLGRAMLGVVKGKAEGPILEVVDINRLGA